MSSLSRSPDGGYRVPFQPDAVNGLPEGTCGIWRQQREPDEEVTRPLRPRQREVQRAAPIDHAGLDPLLRHDGGLSGKQLDVRATRGVENNPDSGDPDRMAHLNQPARS